MPTSSVGPLGPYDLILQNTASSPSTTVGLMLDLDEQGAPRVREFRVPPVPPRQSQGFLADSSLDPLVDYIYVQDDWSGGALRPYYREGDRRYAEADDVDARGEGVLALGMAESPQLSIVVPNGSFERDTSILPWVAGTNATVTIVTTAPRTGSRHMNVSNTDGAGAADYTIPNPADYSGRTITFFAYTRNATSGSTRVSIEDNAGTTNGNSVSGSTYAFSSATRTVTAGCTSLKLHLQPTTANQAMYYDDLGFYASGAETCVGVVEAAGKRYAAVGPLVLRWDETYDFWESVYFEPASTQATGIASFNDVVYVGYGLTVAYIRGNDTTWTKASGGSGEDTYAQFWTVQDNRLWKNETANVLRYSTANPATATTWGTKYTVGEASAPITALYTLNYSIVVGTETGLHTWSEQELRFRNVVNEFASNPDADNFSKGVVRGGWLYVNTAKQGLRRFNGFHIQDLSELLISPRLSSYGGRIRAITQDQQQIFMLMDTPTVDTSTSKTTRLVALRELEEEWQLHTLANVAIGDINALAVAGTYLYGFGRLYNSDVAGYSTSALRWKLPEKSAAPYQDDITVRQLAVTGTINLPIFHAAGEASLIKVEMLVEDTDATNTVAVKFGVDGAAPSTTTLGTTTAVTTTTPAKVTMNASSLTTPTDAHGRMWQFQLVPTRDSTQAAGAHESPKVYGFVAHFVLSPTPVPAWEVFVRLGQPLKTGMLDPTSKTTLLSNLNTLETQAYPITLVEDFSQDNTENSHYVRIREWERVLEDPEVHKGRPAQVGELYRLVLQKIV